MGKVRAGTADPGDITRIRGQWSVKVNMDGETRAFLNRRHRRLAAWRWCGPGALVSMAGLTLWLVLRHPLLVNPLTVARGLADGSLAESTALLMAGLLPLMTSACLLLVFAVLLFVHSSMTNERRLLSITEQLAGQAEMDLSG